MARIGFLCDRCGVFVEQARRPRSDHAYCQDCKPGVQRLAKLRWYHAKGAELRRLKRQKNAA